MAQRWRVDEVVLVGDMAVQRHWRHLELLRERPHGEGLEPALVRATDGGPKDPFPAQAVPRSGAQQSARGHVLGPSVLTAYGVRSSVYSLHELAYAVFTTR